MGAMSEVFDELKRLEEENAALREIAEAVVAIHFDKNGDPVHDLKAFALSTWATRARALLGKSSEEQKQ